MILRIIMISMIFGSILGLYLFNQGSESPKIIASHWIKLDSNGQAMPNWAGPWACVLDTKTGLVWEAKTDNESIHDGSWSYSWLDEKGMGVENWGDCYFEKDRCDTQDLIRHTNNEKSCGLENWRLPSSNELSSLIIEYHRHGEPVIDTSFFPHTKRGDYWTHNAHQPLQGIYRHLKEGATAINFITGETQATPYRNAAFTRLVTSDINREFIDNRLSEIQK